MTDRHCRQCTTPFEVTREWQVFCSNKCRVKWHRGNAHCFYCGAYGAPDRDHVFPVAMRGHRFFDGVEIVKACKSCNGALGSRPYELEERIAYLITHITKKYKLDKDPVQWEPGEVAELGYRLRRKVKRFLAIRKEAEERVIYLKYLAKYVESNAL